MTTTHIETIDMTNPGIPMSRLVRVELRKLVNTRAGFWLVAAIGLISLFIMIAMLIWANDSDLTFGGMFGLMNIPTGLLLPVLTILLVTSEWSQRTGLVTFTLEPRRSRIVIAKLLTALIAAFAAMVAALAFGALGNILAGAFHGGEAGSWDMTWSGIFNSSLLQLAGLVEGFAFGMVIMNSAAAIVIFFILPTLWSVIGQIVPWMRDHLQAWADFDLSMAPFQGGGWVKGDDWAHFAVAGTIWVLIPLALGIWRLLRSEVK